MKIYVSKNLKELSSLFAEQAKLFIVGGYVRNSLLGFRETDVDLASSLTPEKVISLLKDTKFEVLEKSQTIGYVNIKVENEVYEYTAFRKDNYYRGGTHKVQSVSYVEDLRQDAMRRDFTINALYYDIETEKIVDIYSGLLDLKNRVVRTVEVPGYVLAHDGTRILRMIRLASELNFKIDFATLVTAKKFAHLLHDVSAQRKYQELQNILKASTRYPTSQKNAHIRGLGYFNDLRLWNSFYISTSRVHLRAVKKMGVGNIFYAFLIDVIDTVKPDCIEYYLKELLGKGGYCLPNSTIQYTNNIICGYYDALNKLQNKKYFFKYFNYFEKIGELLAVKSKKLYAKYKFFYSYIIKHKLPTNVKELQISGADIKKTYPNLPEKKYGAIMTDLLSKVFDGLLLNEKNTLLEEIKNGFTDTDN
ncbi:MAG: CCA tRNA nucleotidyltransferase [Clostridia bacterium]|nr:CCA tRNA nucleotidyltransferase [Clostridia bacterium]